MPSGYTAQATDNFNRANETPMAGNWSTVTGEGAFNLSSNAAIPNSLGSDCATRYSGRAWTDDQSSVAKITAGNDGATTGTGVLVRAASGARTYYGVMISTSAGANNVLFRRVAGAFTQLGVAFNSGGAAWVNGDELELQVEGPSTAANLTVYKNGTSIFTHTDNSSISSGSPGLVYSSTSARSIVDDWEGREPVVTPVAGPSLRIVQSTLRLA